MANYKNLLRHASMHHQAGNFAVASTYYHKILEKQPEQVDVIFLLGTLYQQDGDLDNAIIFLKKVLALRPDHAEAHNNLGSALKRMGKLNEAEECCRMAISIKPEYAEAHNNLGTVLQQQGKYDEALTSYKLALKLKQDYADAYFNMGNVFKYQGHFDEAISCYQKALQLKQNYAAYVNMGSLFKDIGNVDKAISCYQKAFELKPDPGIDVNAILILPVINKTKAEIERYRNRLIEGIELLENKGLKLEDPYKQVYSTNFFLAYNGLNDKEIQKKIASFYLHTCPDLNWTSFNCNKHQVRYGKINIGIISYYLFNHTIGKINLGIIKKLSREKFHVKLFRFQGGKEDYLSEATNNSADEVVILPTDLKLARKIIADNSLDILLYLDIGMHPLTYFLAFSRLAPVQCVTWGHPETTGIPNIDYFISHDYAEPPEAENHYSECLVRLKRFVMYCDRPKSPDKPKSRLDFGLSKKNNLYFCPQNLIKFHPDFDFVLGAILRQDPRGLILLMEGKYKHWTELLCERFSHTIPDVMDRVRFLPIVPPDDFISLLKVSDVVLDTIHFNGGYTSLLAFAFGIPIVTCPGRFMRGRLTLALYKQMGVMDCVAGDTQTYANVALRLATDKNWRDSVADKISSHADVLYEDMEAVLQLEHFFEWVMKETHKKTSVYPQ